VTDKLTRSDPKAAQLFSPAVVTELGVIETAFGGRSKVISTLACAPKSAEIDYLLNLITSERASASIADLCVAANVRPSELLQHLSAGNVHYARTLAVATLPEHLPQTVADLMRVSHVYEGECADCFGRGEIPTRGTDGKVSPDEFDTCQACSGSGKRMYQPTPEARNKALEIGGLTEKKGGFNLNVGMQQVVQTGSGGGALERVQAAAAVILRDADEQTAPRAARPPVVEGESR